MERVPSPGSLVPTDCDEIGRLRYALGRLTPDLEPPEAVVRHGSAALRTHRRSVDGHPRQALQAVQSKRYQRQPTTLLFIDNISQSSIKSLL